MQLTKLPIEIQENIFHYLDAESLSEVVQVCTTWKDIAMRLIRRRCLKKIPADAILEILCYNPQDSTGKEKDDCPWDKVYLHWMRSQVSDPVTPAIEEITQEEPFTCYKVTGDCIIASDRTGSVNMYNFRGQLVENLAVTGSDVWEVAAMDVAENGPYTINRDDGVNLLIEHNFLVILGHRFAQVYRLPIVGGPPTTDLVWALADLGAMSIAKTSVFGPMFAIAERPSVLNLRKVRLSSDGKVAEVEFLSEIICHTWFWKWKIWGDKVICIFATGEIAVWGLEAATWLSISQRYSELLYQNPCFIYRGVIFCSSRTSQSLLEYWHCFPGDSYWLVCWDGDNFHKYYPKLLMGDDVTAICMKRSLVLLGTATGKLYLYEHKGKDTLIGNIWESNPAFIIQLSEFPIRSCDVSFDGNGLTIAARIKKSTLVVTQLPNRRPKPTPVGNTSSDEAAFLDTSET